MKKQKVLIMMSTYNGERYLEEQLDSILSQKDVEIGILVRDDGSSDNTLTILKSYSSRYPGVFHIEEGDNVGWKRSFHTLIQTAARKYLQFDYFAFADQDDIWLPEKLYAAVDTLGSVPEECALYCCNQYYFKDGKIGQLVNGPIPPPTVKSCLVRNYATGCTIVFNRRMLECLKRGGIPAQEIAHDYWCYMVAVLCGRVYIDPAAYILYRQHDANQIGSKTKWSDTWRRRIKALKTNLGTGYRETTAKELLRTVGELMSPQGREAVMKMAGYRESPRKRFALLKDKGYTLNSRSSDFWLKLRIIIGRV